MKPRTERSRPRNIGPLLVLLGLLLLAVWAGRLFLTLRSLQERVAGAQRLLSNDPRELDLPQVEALLRDTRQDIAILRGDGAPILWVAPALGWVPRWGGTLAAAPDLLELADGLTEAALLAWDDLAPLVVLLRDGQPDSQDRSLLMVLANQLSTARPALAQSQGALRQAIAARARLSPEQLVPSLRGAVDRLDQILPLLDHGLAVAQAAPGLLGMDGERHYLILAQNEDELRATGGFITGYGIVTIHNGQIVQATFDNSYNADDYSQPYPDAPAAMYRLMGIDLWVFRDSNWSPDFPTAAQQALDLFRPATPATIDGVIALDQEMLRRLVAAVGPLEVAGQTVHQGNVIAHIRAEWAPTSGDWTPEEWRKRKAFMGDVASAILDRLQNEAGRVDWQALSQAIQGLLEEKHLLLYFPQEPEIADLLAQYGWDGALRPWSGDFLLVVDSNVGYNKVNPLIEQEIVYQVDLASARPAVTVTLHYTHTGRPLDSPCRPQVYSTPLYTDMMQRCYWNYLRLYVPVGSHLQGGRIPLIPGEELWNGQAIVAAPAVEPAELGRQVFSAALVMPPGETRTLSFYYDLPAVLHDEDGQWHYRLLLQKQPGTTGHQATVVVRLPAQAKTVSCQPFPCPKMTPLAFHLTLDHDQEVEVIYTTP